MSAFNTTQELFAALCEPFASDEVEWRVGSTNADKTKCLPLCYLDARAVMDRLDAVCGPDGWQNSYSTGVNGSIVCNIGIACVGSWVWKADGAGETHIEGEKGALSDAFKRAAVRWGVGRYLYEIKAPWIPLDQGKYISDTERKKLKEFYEDYGARTAGWGSRAGGQVYRALVKVVNEYVTDPVAAQDFKEKNKAELALLPAAMKRHLLERLDRVGANSMEAA